MVATIVAIALSVVAVAYGATRSTTTRRAAGSGACGALMSNPKALEAMQDLRAEHQGDMQAWSDRYGADPSSAEAQAALRNLREEHWNDMREVFEKYGVDAPVGAGPAGVTPRALAAAAVAAAAPDTVPAHRAPATEYPARAAARWAAGATERRCSLDAPD